MLRKLVGIVVLGVAVGLPLPAALAAGARANRAPLKGELVVTFSGSGGGTYRYHEPALGGTATCRVADTTYTEIDAYHWSYSFIVPAAGGTSDTPWTSSGSGELTGTDQLLQCGDDAAVTSTCTQALRTPLPTDSSDLAYPGVIVGAAGRRVTVGALGELIPATAEPLCTGFGTFEPNLLEGFSQLQATVSFSRAQLASTGYVKGRFTMAGAGLYDGVPLSGSCDSVSCDVHTCTAGSAGGGGAPNSCSFSENYVGLIEVRVVN